MVGKEKLERAKILAGGCGGLTILWQNVSFDQNKALLTCGYVGDVAQIINFIDNVAYE